MKAHEENTTLPSVQDQRKCISLKREKNLVCCCLAVGCVTCNKPTYIQERIEMKVQVSLCSIHIKQAV